MDKAAWRLKLKTLRKNLSADVAQAKSKSVAEITASLDIWSSSKTAHIYKAMPELQEVDTQPLIRQLGQRYPNLKISSPSPHKDAPLPRKTFDVVIVPMLGFDENLHRLGMGGGWYDRFLAEQPQALKIGLAYNFSLIENGIPNEPHDIALDIIVTETGIQPRAKKTPI